MARKGIIIGGGASGLMAAITAAERGAKVTILEHMPRVGKKILSTGNGKCNMTNRFMEPSCYRSGEDGFPMAVIRQFPVEETLRFFRRLGILTTERNGYVYPASGQAQTVLDALREQCESLGVETVCECEIQEIRRKQGFQIFTNQGTFDGEFLIMAAGSMAAKNTGSDGSGYALARSLGHKIKKPLPALVQLRCGESFFKSISGVRADGRIRLYSNGSFLAEDRGELQLTDYGISGIPVFQVSRFASQALDRKEKVSAEVDFFPDHSWEECLAILKDQRRFLSGRPAESFLNGMFHKKLAALFLKEAGILKKAEGRKAGEISDKELKRLADQIKNFPLTITGTNPFEQAQVCMGGVRVSEVDPATMESRLVQGLFFAGEILDVDGICGGYNLQWAWSSGYLAGRSAAGK